MESMPEHAAVVVVGSGPTGLAVALGLARQGVRCALVPDHGDAADRNGETARLSAHGMSLLVRLGVDTAALPVGRWDRSTTFVGGQQIGSAAPAESAPYANVPIGGVVNAMRDALAASRDCVVASASVVSVEADATGVMVVAELPSTGPVSCRADYVVMTSPRAGAPLSDPRGAEMVKPPATSPQALRHGNVLMLADVEADPPFPAERRLHLDPPWHPTGHVLVEPVAPGHWRIEWPAEVATDPEAVHAQVRAALGDGVPYVLRAVRCCPAGWRLPLTFHDGGRVFFAGDATHVPARLGVHHLDPGLLGAADLARGLEDADNLAWKLAYAVRGDGDDELLRSYEVERRAAVELQLDDLADALRNLSPATRTSRWRRHAGVRGRRRATRLGEIEQALAADPETYSSAILQPGAGALAPELPVRATDGWRGPLAGLRGGAITVVAIGPTETEAVALAVAVEAASLARAATTVGWSLPPHRFVGGAAANATTGLDAAGTALGNLLVVRPDGRVSWKVNGEDAPDEVAAALAAALSRTVGR